MKKLTQDQIMRLDSFRDKLDFDVEAAMPDNALEDILKAFPSAPKSLKLTVKERAKLAYAKRQLLIACKALVLAGDAAHDVINSIDDRTNAADEAAWD